MFSIQSRFAVLGSAVFLALTPTACGQDSLEDRRMSQHPNSIQPETTLDISAEGRVDREPDIATISAGVQTERKTAVLAMAENAKAMNGVFKALEKAGVAKKDMQTSNFSLNPKYEYIRSTGKQVLKGYQASNQLSVRVRDLDTLGETLDALVGAGGNTFSGLQFGLDDDSAVRDEARTKAMKNARAKAKLYADAAGMEVARIVSISESGNYNRPQPMMQARMQAVESSGAPTPIAGGEVGYTANVNVRFELR